MPARQFFSSEELQNFANNLKASGMRIFYAPSKFQINNSWFYYTDGENIGYCQIDYSGGFSFSTVHKPCKECGTGFGIHDNNIYNPTLEDARAAFIVAPKWVSPRAKNAVVKYANMSELIHKCQILKYIEY